MYLLKRLYIIQIVLQKHASTFFLLMLMLRAIRAVENAGKSGMKFSYSIAFSDHEKLSNYDIVNIFLMPTLVLRKWCVMIILIMAIIYQTYFLHFNQNSNVDWPQKYPCGKQFYVLTVQAHALDVFPQKFNICFAFYIIYYLLN